MTLAAWTDSFPRYSMIKRKYVTELPFARLAEAVVREFGRPDDDRDGLWFRRPGGWMHLRPSGTEPVVRLISEGTDRDSLERDLEAFNGILETPCVE